MARDRGCKFDDRVEVGATMLLAAARCAIPDALIAGVWDGGVVKGAREVGESWMQVI